MKTLVEWRNVHLYYIKKQNTDIINITNIYREERLKGNAKASVIIFFMLFYTC